MLPQQELLKGLSMDANELRSSRHGAGRTGEMAQPGLAGTRGAPFAADGRQR